MKSAIIGILVSPLLLMAQPNGVAWTNIGPSPAAVEALAVEPQGTGRLFMGTIDGGSTWSAVNSGLTTPIIQALAMDASGSQTVHAGCLRNGRGVILCRVNLDDFQPGRGRY